MNNWYVRIIQHEGDEIINEMGPFSESKADLVSIGCDINLNHEDFYTTIIQKETKGE